MMSYLFGLQFWSDFKSRVSSLLKKGKGDAFEAFVHAYLKLDPQYTTLLQDVWLLRDVPLDVRTHLNLPDRDEGIDLVARTREGAFWAIQCKYIEDEDHSLSRKALSTFTDLAFTVCRNIDYALVCTTADRYSHKLSLYGERLGFLAGDTWRNLDADFFVCLDQYLQGQKVYFPPRAPRPHQVRAIENAEFHFLTEGNSRGKLILPCGTGKSLTGYWIAERLQAKTILVAVPSLSLVRQTLKEWLRESVAKENEVRWIAVCSDESVADQKREDVAVYTQDLGIRVHTDPEEIAIWLKGDHEGLTVLFTTYQSGKATAEAARLSGITFDLAIMDEAHKTVGKRNSLFSHLLFDENLPVRHRVFMTATERRYAGDSDQIVSMTDPQLYGDTFELLTFKEALEADPPILSDYKIVTIVVTRAEIRGLVQENLFVRPDQGRWDDDVEAEMLAAAIALRKAIQKHPIRHAVSFHSSISRARVFKSTQDALTKAFPDFGHLETFHVSGNTPTAKRSKELERFVATSPSLVTNARCLTEGVDVPDIDCVLFADPKRSTVDIVQAVGRALRRAEGKEFGYVIVPVLIDGDLGDDPDAQYEAFAPVLTVLRSLAGNDERIVEYFRSVSEGRRRTSGEGGEIIDIPDGVFIDANAFVESIELKFWGRLAKLSWRPFEEARGFARNLGLLNVPEWEAYCRGEFPKLGHRPADIPANPSKQYLVQGWQGFGDWLGTGTIAPFNKEFRPFNEARHFARSLKLKNVYEWESYRKGEMPSIGRRPEDIPAGPSITYKGKGWVGYRDWLGTERLTFEEARIFARSLRLKAFREWGLFCKGEMPEKGTLPPNIPASPDLVYKNQGWTNWMDWLETETKARRHPKGYLPFEEARVFARSLGLKSSHEWKAYRNGGMNVKGSLPSKIPKYPSVTYKNHGWIDMKDWLGTGWRSFEEARHFARNLHLVSSREWQSFCQGDIPQKGSLSEDIPASPDRVYKDQGWKSWSDWLGTLTKAPRKGGFISFEEARTYVRNLNLQSSYEWKEYCKGQMLQKGKLPENIPATPSNVYKNKGWIGFKDWLGIDYLPFEKARDYARSLNLKTFREWRKFCSGNMPEKGNLPVNVPSSPHQFYKNDGWRGHPDWLGKK